MLKNLFYRFCWTTPWPGLDKNANLPGRSLHFQQIPHYGLCISYFLYVKSQEFPSKWSNFPGRSFPIPYSPLVPALTLTLGCYCCCKSFSDDHIIARDVLNTLMGCLNKTHRKNVCRDNSQQKQVAPKCSRNSPSPPSWVNSVLIFLNLILLKIKIEINLAFF